MSIIKVDVDDTILETVETWLQLYRMMTDEPVYKHMIHSWAIGSYVNDSELLYSILDWPTLYKMVKPVRLAVETVTELIRRGYAVRFVTGADNIGKLNRLIDLGFGASKKSYYVANYKAGVNGNWIVDDNFDTLKDHDPERAILFTQPWNIEYNWPLRAMNWRNVYTIITEKDKS